MHIAQSLSFILIDSSNVHNKRYFFYTEHTANMVNKTDHSNIDDVSLLIYDNIYGIPMNCSP